MSRRNHSMLAGAKDVAPILLGIVPFGLVAGAAVIEAGFGHRRGGRHVAVS